MNVEVFLSGYNVEDADVRGRVAVVIDVLRTSSTIIHALYNGARSVVPVSDMAEAGKIAANMDPLGYQLGGERAGEPIEGYHLGNSPLEYTPDVVSGRTIILNTTNGTSAIQRCARAAHVVIGSFLNARRIVEFVRQLDVDLSIVCAGWRNRVSLEDTLCAGLILYDLWNGQEPEDRTDTAHMAFTQYRNDREDLEGAVRRSGHGKRLARLERVADVEFCIRLDALPVLPYLDENQLVLLQ